MNSSNFLARWGSITRHRHRAFLNVHFPDKSIVNNRSIVWPARSPDLSPLDYFLWPFWKTNCTHLCDYGDFENMLTRYILFIFTMFYYILFILIVFENVYLCYYVKCITCSCDEKCVFYLTHLSIRKHCAVIIVMYCV